MVSPLAEKTIKHVSAKLESGEAAGLSEIVELIQKLSSNAYETSVQDLGGLIGKDVVVTAKVIAAANTIGYNPSGVDVSSITEAIHVIGFNKIRQLTVSLLLVENANRTLNPSEKREIAALALCSGLMAEAIMNDRGTLPSEHAFICASLRSYGRLLMTSFMIEDYRRARIMATTGVTEDEAFNRVFGLTPLELGHHLLACAHLPEPILKSLRTVPADVLRSANQHPDMELLALADLSVRVCELALRTDVGAVEFIKKAEAIATRYSKLFSLDADALIKLLCNTGQQLNEFAHTFGLKALSAQVAPRLNARARGENPSGYTPPGPQARSPAETKEPPSALETSEIARPAEMGFADNSPSSIPLTPSAGASANPLSSLPSDSMGEFPLPAVDFPPAAVPEAGTPASPIASAAEATFHRAFQSGIEQLAELLEEEPIAMEKVYRVILKAAIHGFESTDALIFTRDRNSAKYTPTCGDGPFFNDIRRLASFREEERSVFGICLQRLEDVLIYDATDPKIAAHIPSWARTGKQGSFVLLPLHENRRVFAVLMVAWPGKKTASFTASQIRHVRSMLKLAGTARKLSDSP